MKKLSKKNPKLSIVVLNHNTKDLLYDCLVSLEKVKDEVVFRIIVSDNGSTDGSLEMLEHDFPEVVVIKSPENLGFSAGNNRARKYCDSKYILFLNSDTVVKPGTIKETTTYLDDHPEVGAITCKILLPDGSLDRDARRSFITPWIGLVHLFLRLDRIFPNSKTFARYWYGYLSPDLVHEVDAIQGAYFMARKDVLEKVGWWDEDYFLDGEDIDLSYRIHQAGYKIVYYPKVEIIHYRGATKGKIKNNGHKVSLSEKIKFRTTGVTSQEIFYKKHLWNKHSLILNLTVIAGIKFLKLLRIIKTVLLG